MPPSIGPVERGQHQVQVDRQAVHEDDLVGPGADQPGPRVADQFVIGVPRRLAAEVPLDAVLRPGVQFLRDELLAAFRGCSPSEWPHR